MKKLPIFMTVLITLTILISLTIPASSAAPKRIFIDFKDAYLVHSLSSGAKQVVAEGNVLSYGRDWQIIKLKSYLYHMRLKTWKGFYWKVNTSRKEVYQVTGGTFGKMGGNSKKKNFSLNVVGGSGTETPDRFMIQFPNAYLVYIVNSGALQITAGGNVLSYGSDWQSKKLSNRILHLKLNAWKNFFWKVNTKRKKAFRIRDGVFGKPKHGGEKEKLNATVRVE